MHLAGEMPSYPRFCIGSRSRLPQSENIFFHEEKKQKDFVCFLAQSLNSATPANGLPAAVQEKHPPALRVVADTYAVVRGASRMRRPRISG